MSSEEHLGGPPQVGNESMKQCTWPRCEHCFVSTLVRRIGSMISGAELIVMRQVASWWDYGYQTTAMANRTVIVDNNTWNNTHIATVGRAMASPEHQAWQIYRDLDVKYVLVVFGGFVG